MAFSMAGLFTPACPCYEICNAGCEDASDDEDEPRGGPHNRGIELVPYSSSNQYYLQPDYANHPYGAELTSVPGGYVKPGYEQQMYGKVQPSYEQNDQGQRPVSNGPRGDYGYLPLHPASQSQTSSNNGSNNGIPRQLSRQPQEPVSRNFQRSPETSSALGSSKAIPQQSYSAQAQLQERFDRSVDQTFQPQQQQQQQNPFPRSTKTSENPYHQQQPSFQPQQQQHQQPSFQPQQQQPTIIPVPVYATDMMTPSVPTEELYAMGVQYIPPQQLVAMMDARDRGQQQPNFVIVDLRGTDFAGGHIRGCTNIPSTDLIGNLDGAISRLQNAEVVIFHCLISKHRAPQCAKFYKQRLQMHRLQQTVLILEGGFHTWREMYTGNPALIEQDAAMTPDQVQRQVGLGIQLGQQFIATAPQNVR